MEKKAEMRPRISRERAEEIEMLASIVADEHCDGLRTDPVRVAREKEITVSFGQYGDAFDGMLEYDGRRWHIYSNLDRENHPESARGRFTVAHELGHYFIDEHRLGLASGSLKPHASFADKSVPDLKVEREADLFASFFLMPSIRFATFTKKCSRGLLGIKEIADRFLVSLTCAAIRYVTSSVTPAVIVKWSSDGYQWHWCSREFWEAGFRKTIQQPDRLLDGSATARTLDSSGAVGKIEESGSVVSAWFTGTAKGGKRDILLREEATSLGRFGAITLLRPADEKIASELSRLSALDPYGATLIEFAAERSYKGTLASEIRQRGPEMPR